MLLSYIKLSLRLLARNPFSTFINVAGLSVGFTVFFVLWQYSQSELKSDQFHKDYEQIYKIGCYAQWTDDNINYQGSICGANHYGITDIVAKHTHVLDRTDFFAQRYFSEPFTQGHGSKIFMSYTDEKENQASFVENKIIYAEPNFFQFFSIQLLQGNPQNILARPDAIVISEAVAKKYFGNDNPVGKTLHLNNTIPLQVTGVFQNLPKNTHFDFDIVISTERIRATIDRLMGGELFYSFSFCKLPAGTVIDELKNRINANSGNEVSRKVWGTWPSGKAEILFQPLKEVAFEALRFDTHRSKSRYLLYVFSVASIIILAMGWINHVNLALASASKRFKELGARKAVGAKSTDFIAQFMVEVILVNLLSILVALTLIQLVRSPAELFLQFHMPGWDSISPSTWIISGSVLIFGIVLTGTYLAFISMRRTPKSLFLAHQVRNSNNTNWLLSLFQFSGTCVLVIWIFTVHRQISFILNRDIGLVRDHVLVIDLPFQPTENFRNDIDQLTWRASRLPGIAGYTVSSNVTADYWEGRMGLSLREGTGAQVESNGGVDENFISFFGVKLLAGRNFQPGNPTDKKSILISRGAALRLGLKNPGDAIGQKLLDPPDSEIIGVFEDYNLRPLIRNDEITYNGLPGIGLSYQDYLLPQLGPRKISFRVTSEKFEETINDLEKIYRESFMQNVFNWYFLNDQINNQYQSDKTARNQILFFSIVAIGIACLGLLGLISNKVVEKTKEIGIRKVLGAQLPQIAQILLNTTAKQMGAATIMGIPIAYYLANQYLEKFSEHIELQWWYFVLPVLLLAVIMFSTVASMLWKAAKSNPVEALKCE